MDIFNETVPLLISYLLFWNWNEWNYFRKLYNVTNYYSIQNNFENDCIKWSWEL